VCVCVCFVFWGEKGCGRGQFVCSVAMPMEDPDVHIRSNQFELSILFTELQLDPV